MVLITFFSRKGLIHHYFVPPNQTLNTMFYLEVMECLVANPHLSHLAGIQVSWELVSVAWQCNVTFGQHSPAVFYELRGFCNQSLTQYTKSGNSRLFFYIPKITSDETPLLIGSLGYTCEIPVKIAHIVL